jgi:hypothetical protein
LPKGKPWKVKEELLLKTLINQGERMEVIAAKMGKTTNSVYLKAKRMGLKEEVTKCGSPSSSIELELPPELPSIETALKILAAALETAKQPNLNRTEILKLNAVVNLVRTYQSLLAEYIDYRGIERKLLEMEAKYAQLVKKTS